MCRDIEDIKSYDCILGRLGYVVLKCMVTPNDKESVIDEVTELIATDVEAGARSKITPNDLANFFNLVREFDFENSGMTYHQTLAHFKSIVSDYML